MSLFTTITNDDYYETIKEDSVDGVTIWTINKNGQVGDLVLLYVCAPISAIVAVATISDIPYQDEEVNSMWFKGWFAAMDNLKMLKNPISRKELLTKFPDWGYWKQPRNSVQVKREYVCEIEKLINER